jgi:formate dehydrogenase subunit gamma
MIEAKNLEGLEVERYTTKERIIHWWVGFSFLFLFLSGLGLFSPKFSWLLTVLGGKEFVRWLHPIVGIFFMVGIVRMYLSWWKDFKLDSEDRVWLKNIKHYIRGEEEKLPPVGKYNAGQKLYGRVMIYGAVLFLISGIFMWYPLGFPKPIVRIAILVHEMLFIILGPAFIVHVYMSTLAMPGTLRAMITGKVSGLWALSHHPKWFNEVFKK